MKISHLWVGLLGEFWVWEPKNLAGFEGIDLKPTKICTSFLGLIFEK